MKRLVFAAVAVAFLSSSAFAQGGNSFSFTVDGQNVRVHVPKSCMSLSCISVSAPGLKDDDDDRPARVARPAVAAQAPVAAAPTQPAAPAAPIQAMPAPAPTAVQQASLSPPPSAPPAQASAPVAPVAVQSAAPAAPAPATVASAPVTAPAPVQTPAAAPAIANTPIGVWMTEKNEGKVRVEKCGDNLCGYAVDEKTNGNGEQVLIAMKPKGDKWAGRIHDSRGGGTYDSTIAMRGDNGLRVQGCAFGGMFCGGQTWTRVQ